MRGEFIYIPIEEATSPKNGECLVDRWWSVHPEKGVAFYVRLFGPMKTDEPSPQCNPNKRVSEHINNKLNPDCEVKQISVVFLAHAQERMGELRKVRRQQNQGGNPNNHARPSRHS